MPFKITHGMSKSKEYQCWSHIKKRCLNPNHKQYNNYGGRGITISDDWLKFENFFNDMGLCPNNYEIDRIDNNQGYFKGNCRWVDKKTNCRNKRTNKKHKINDSLVVQQHLIELIGWTKHQFKWYLKKNGIEWILENFKNGTLPQRVNISIDPQEIVGKKFGKWIVLSFHKYKKSSGNIYKCVCECGEEKMVIGYHLRVGKSTQCRKCSYKNQINKPK